MFISVHHRIKNPGDFWTAAQNSLPNLPEPGVQRVCNVYPSSNMTEAFCVWEADSIESLDKYLRRKVKDWSEEHYFEIDAAHAMGLPK